MNKGDYTLLDKNQEITVYPIGPCILGNLDGLPG
jgi:hypothetical protein